MGKRVRSTSGSTISWQGASAMTGGMTGLAKAATSLWINPDTGASKAVAKYSRAEAMPATTRQRG